MKKLFARWIAFRDRYAQVLWGGAVALGMAGLLGWIEPDFLVNCRYYPYDLVCWLLY